MEWLSYDFVALDSRHDFSPAAPWEGTLGDFDCRLDAGRLEARPHFHYSEEAEAKAALESHLRAWELRSELEDGVQVGFRFGAAHVIDRQPDPESVSVAVSAVGSLSAVGEVTIKVGHRAYPPPSARALAGSPLVDDLLEWVRDVREQRQRMLVGAYLVLTRIEFEYGDRDQAATTLNISKKVLSNLGELSARNDPAERRKVKGPVSPLTEPERRWILATLPKLTCQVAEVEAGSRPALLEMASLPPL